MMAHDDSHQPRTAVIVQPCFFPWRGQFDLFSRGDVNIFLDDVQFSRGSWYNRNKIMTPQGPVWITVPVKKKGMLQCLIKEMPISYRDKWQEKILGQLYSAYKKTPFFRTYYPPVEELIRRDWTYISELSMASVAWSFVQLGRPVTFLVSSDLGVNASDPVERVVELCKSVGADRYLSGPAAKDYMGEAEPFRDAGIELEWMQYPEYPPYRSDNGEEMSILDLLFRIGPDSPRYIWEEA